MHAEIDLKPKISRERTELDYVIPGYSFHPVNLNSNIRPGVIIYIYIFILRLITA